ncbi:Squalene/phytoene synthase [Plasmodiophora brassicae]
MSDRLARAVRQCVDTVRRHDREHYLCTLLLPDTVRSASFVLRAFNVEVSRIDRSAQDPAMSRIRLMWWRDTLEKVSNPETRVEHPVAVALQHAIGAYAFPRRWVSSIVDARDRDTEPTSMADMEKRFEACHSTLLYLTLHGMGIRDLHADHAASHIGKAVGIVTALRAIPGGYSANLPRDLLARGIRFDRANPALADLTYELACQAKQHLDHARSMRDSVPADARPVLLPAVPCSAWLDRIERANFDVFDRRFAPGHGGALSTPLRLLYYRFRKRY